MHYLVYKSLFLIEIEVKIKLPNINQPYNIINVSFVGPISIQKFCQKLRILYQELSTFDKPDVPKKTHFRKGENI